MARLAQHDAQGLVSVIDGSPASGGQSLSSVLAGITVPSSPQQQAITAEVSSAESVAATLEPEANAVEADASALARDAATRNKTAATRDAAALDSATKQLDHSATDELQMLHDLSRALPGFTGDKAFGSMDQYIPN